MNSDAEAKRAGVDFLMVGDVSKRGDKVMATMRLEDAAQGVTVYSQRLEADGESVRDLPDRIGAQLAGDLSWSAPLMILDRRRPLDPTQMAELFASQQSEDPLQAYQMARRSAASMPNTAVAQIALAYSTAFGLSLIPLDERAAAVANARRAAARAISLQPDNGDTYSTWCILHSETSLAECEDRLREGRRISPDASFVNTFLSHLLRGAGRFEEATDLARLSYTHDIYYPTKIAWMLRMLEYSGERDEAQRVYAQAIRWYPDSANLLFRNRLFGLIDRGDFAAILRLEQDLGKDTLPTGYEGSGPLVAALKAKSVPAMRRACPDSRSLIIRCMVALAMVGDLDGAYRLADEAYATRLGRTPAETERIWLNDPTYLPAEFITSPAAAPMRRDPRYLRLVERIGLLAYWRSGRRPDFCRKDPEPICAQLLNRGR
jgi:tetratricopeptide (TPR) repeat protein